MDMMNAEPETRRNLLPQLVRWSRFWTLSRTEGVMALEPAAHESGDTDIILLTALVGIMKVHDPVVVARDLELHRPHEDDGERDLYWQLVYQAATTFLVTKTLEEYSLGLADVLGEDLAPEARTVLGIPA